MKENQKVICLRCGTTFIPSCKGQQYCGKYPCSGLTSTTSGGAY